MAWHPLGWQPQFFSEIEKFPCKVLQHHFPSVPNLGDMTKFKEWPDVGIDLLVGGTPCQAFSVAGLRQGLADPRGNLALVYLGVVDKYRPRWVVWENVPGVLLSSGGRDFGAFLGALGQLGYGFAYRVLDAQHFGVPQRRRRVFVVGHLGDWRCAAAVLFEREGVRGDTTTSRGARQIASALTKNGAGVSGADNNQAQAGHLIACIKGAAIGREPQNGPQWGEVLEDGTSFTLNCVDRHAVSVSFRDRDGSATAELSGEIVTALRASQDGGDKTHVLTDVVRRLTPRECERLQGLPDDWTAIPGAFDSARYKAIGNSMAVPCMRWIGEGIAEVDKL